MVRAPLLVISLLASVALVGCGQGDPPAEGGPKSRANDRPIQRELERQTAPRREETSPARGPLARVEPAARAAEAPVAAAPDPASYESETAAPEAAPSEPTEAESPEPSELAVAPAPTPAPGALTVSRLLAAVAVEDREPTGAPRADAERTFAFVEAANASDVDAELSVVFVDPDGVEGRPIALSLPVSRRWRTWASTRHTQGRPGRWSVEVRDPAGARLARADFDVAAASPGES